MSTESKQIRVVVVDDEPLEINLIKKCINWEVFNMEIVGEAQNAISGMELVEGLSPDILFTDINMPIIDGIKFSEMVIQRRFKTKIVILSGYDDFRYAQKSIKIGVSDFLLKPINNDEVFMAASKLKNIIDYERESSNEYNLLKRQLSDNLPYIKEKFLIELIDGNLENEKIINKALFLGLRFKYQSVQVAVVEINSLSTYDDNVDNGTYFIQKIKIMNMIKDAFQENEFIYVFYDTLNRIIILNNNENIDLFEKCETLKMKISDNIQYPVNIGLGEIKKHVCEVPASYKEALKALKPIKIINAKQACKSDCTIIKAKKYIDDNLENNKLSLSLMAKHLYLNPSYLSRMFKKELGISFVEYLTKIRMEKAIELLKEGHMKAFEIADSVGISDSNYFSTCFKKYTGLSISKYKKNN